MLEIGFISLGCPKNQLDLELMLGQTAAYGYRITSRIEDADVIVVNTCSFIAPALEEADRNIRDAAKYKEHGKCRFLIVSGCLPQYLKEKALSEYPFVDAFMTPDDVMSLAGVIRSLESQDHHRSDDLKSLLLPTFLYSGKEPRILSTPPGMAYVKIAEGCSHRCSFCIIPQLRGRYRSRSVESIAIEIESLVEKDIKEIVLISQDSTQFGRDRKDAGENLRSLYERLITIPGDFWIRTMYLYPNRVVESVLDIIKNHSDRILPYFDIPIQHISSDLLGSMGRIGDQHAIIRCLEQIRRDVPGAVIRTSLIVGFPGETEEQFEELLAFISQGLIDRLGVFTFSNHPGIPVYQEFELISEMEKSVRRDLLMKEQAKIAQVRSNDLVGLETRILIQDRKRIDGRSYAYTGRSYRDANEIDGVVLIRSKKRRPTGEFANARITKAHTYDLEASFLH